MGLSREGYQMALAYLIGSPTQTLARSRLTPICTLLHLSCRALGDRLEIELDAYGKSVEFSGLQFKPEFERFADFLKRRVENGTLRIHWLPELLDFELARNELRSLPRRRLLAELAQRGPVKSAAAVALNPLVRIARFPCDSTALIEALSNGELVSRAVMKPETYVLLSVLHVATPEVLPADPVLGRLLWALRCVGTFCGDAAQRAALLDMGALVTA